MAKTRSLAIPTSLPNVLIIEDDYDIAELISIHLNDLAVQTKHCTSGEAGLDLIAAEVFDLIILDIMLPGIDGFEVCKKLRAQGVIAPVIMLTSKSEEIDKVLGLEIGADDYLTKPFSVREFVARVKAIFRRKALHEGAGDQRAEFIIKIEDLLIDQGKRKVTKSGNRVELTPKEYDLLLLLALHPGKNYSREDLLNAIWGYEFAGYEHTLNSHINRLR
ncbi:MAG TPA: response regulator transcription factor, partial [Cyclobacteriaceae bacterium]|nr:response regulator transcription factor [Cyclobacteriaceae bacterium]